MAARHSRKKGACRWRPRWRAVAGSARARVPGHVGGQEPQAEAAAHKPLQQAWACLRPVFSAPNLLSPPIDASSKPCQAAGPPRAPPSTPFLPRRRRLRYRHSSQVRPALPPTIASQGRRRLQGSDRKVESGCSIPWAVGRRLRRRLRCCLCMHLCRRLCLLQPVGAPARQQRPACVDVLRDGVRRRL